jgi:hypothetical protein
MCASRVTRHTTIRYSSSCHTRVNIRTYCVRPNIASDLAELKARITAAVKNIDAPVLTCVWQELEYRIDVYRVTRDAHIEHL